METPNSTKNCAILFADIVDSSRLYGDLGDKTAHKFIDEGITFLKDIVSQYFGTIIKTIGDEIMAEFDDAKHAVQAAIFMIKMLKNMEETEGAEWGHLHIKIGIHYGPVIHKDSDVFGNTVNIAARVVAEAKDSQILVTQSVTEELDSSFETRIVDKTKLKGIKDEIVIHEVLGAEDDISYTAVMGDDIFEEFQISTDLSQSELILEIADKTIRMNSDNDRIKMGRSPDNEVVINHDGVSRLHATIEYKNSRFILTDKSTNGTFVTEMNGSRIHLHRNDLTLSDNGIISLGMPQEENSPHVIKYQCRSQ